LSIKLKVFSNFFENTPSDFILKIIIQNSTNYSNILSFGTQQKRGIRRHVLALPENASFYCK